MRQCQRCGVELEGEPEYCSLCGAPLDGVSEEAPGLQSAVGVDTEIIDPDKRRRARFWLWEVFSIVIVATGIIVAAADFAYGFDLSWAPYPLVSLAFIWLFVTAVIALGRDLPLAYASATISVLLYLFVLDALMPGQPWFINYALPTTLLVAVVGGAAAGTVRSLSLSLFPTMATGLVFTGLFLVGLEVILHFAIGTDAILSWSIVAAGGCVSIGLLLWLINKRLREKHADFKRVFHI